MRETGTMNVTLPKHPFADKNPLTIDDIEPGLVMEYWHRGEKIAVETVISIEKDARVRIEGARGSRSVSLVDRGIVRYPNGEWNSVNYAIKQPESKTESTSKK